MRAVALDDRRMGDGGHLETRRLGSGRSGRTDGTLRQSIEVEVAEWFGGSVANWRTDVDVK